jgi:hypothetical protein
MTALEAQETTITLARTDPVVRVYTADTRHLRLLRKLAATYKDLVREVRGGDEDAEFEVSAEFFWLRSAFRRKRVLPDDERAARSARLTAARELRRPASVDEQLREREV